MLKKIKKVAISLLAFLIVVLVAAVIYGYQRLQNSLPEIDGQAFSREISQDVEILRDAQGKVTINADSWNDAAYALGFVHGQDRYFSMDVARRAVTGELSELFGKATFDYDSGIRIHRFKNRAKSFFANLSKEDRANLVLYAGGVNAGLSSLSEIPFEYSILSMQPKEWNPEDSLLIIYSMYLSLQDSSGNREYQRYLAQQKLSEDMLKFLFPMGSQFDAAIDMSELPLAKVPEFPRLDSKEQLNGHNSPAPIGSNNWVVAGSLTTHGAAIVADDMHLSIGVPNIWYRAQVNIGAAISNGPENLVNNNSEEASDARSSQRVVGVTLPGAPAFVVGSNGHIAWGFTNSYGDWHDIIKLQLNPDNPLQYKTDTGYRDFDIYKEDIVIGDSERQIVEVKETIWGPVIRQDKDGIVFVYRWVAHDSNAVNLKLDELRAVTSAKEALDKAKSFGIPAQNFVVGDSVGNIGWTIAGPIPNRLGYDGQYPADWSDSSNSWNGYLAPADYPEIYNPDSGRIWTANTRVIGGESLAKVGDGGYDIGHRGLQIKTNLFAQQQFTESDMLAIQLDDRAHYLLPWKLLFLKSLEQYSDFDKDDILSVLNRWDGRATPGSEAYALLKKFRSLIGEAIAAKIDGLVEHDDFAFLTANRQWGATFLRVIASQKRSWLPRQFSSYDLFLLHMLKKAWHQVKKGEYQFTGTVKPQHLLARVIPGADLLLSMPEYRVSGDRYMPKISRTAYGASERMVVAPGQEESAIFHMPSGQVANPLSPFWGKGHEDWIEGKASPLFTTNQQHTFILKAESQQ